MHITIEPYGRRFRLATDGWGCGVSFPTYDAAVRVANAIADNAVNPSGIVTIDYSACVETSDPFAELQALQSRTDVPEGERKARVTE